MQWRIHAPRAKMKRFSLLLSQWVWNLRNKLTRKNRGLIRIEESAILFDLLSVDLFTSLHSAPRAFHSQVPRRCRTCTILPRAFDVLRACGRNIEDMLNAAIPMARRKRLNERIVWLRLETMKPNLWGSQWNVESLCNNFDNRRCVNVCVVRQKLLD